jgi:excisionase family DNA binding protein
MQPTTTHAHELPLVLKPQDIQQLLSLSRGKTYDLLHQKGFPVVRIGRCLRVPRDGFLRWLEAEGN